MSAHRENSTPWFHRFIAAAGVALLLLLTVSAASPALHHWLHGDTLDDPSSDNCAVVLFSSGLALAAAAIAVAAPRATWSAVRLAPLVEVFLTAPRYLRQPERGPPGC